MYCAIQTIYIKLLNVKKVQVLITGRLDKVFKLKQSNQIKESLSLNPITGRLPGWLSPVSQGQSSWLRNVVILGLKFLC